MIRNQIKNDNVLYKLVEGKSFQSIADELGVSKTTISNVVKKLEKEIGEKNLTTILEIGTAVKKSGNSFVQILSCMRIFKILEKQNLDDDHVHGLLSEIIPKINDVEEFSKLINAAKMVLDLQELTDMDPDEIENYCDAKRQEIASLDEQFIEATEKTEQAIITMNDTLKENNVTKEDLDNYVKNTCYLKKNGADVDDLPIMVNMLKNSSKEKHTPKTIIAEISKNYDLKQRNVDQEAQYKHNLEKNQLKIKENQELDDTIETKRPILEQVKKFEKIHVTFNHLLTLYQKVVEIGAKTGISTSKIIEKFTHDITQYEEKIRFENIINHQKQEIKSNKQNLEKIKEEENKVKAKVKTQRKEIIKLEATFEEYKNVIIKINQDMTITQKKNYDDLEEYGKISISHFGSKLISMMDNVIKNLNYTHTRNMNNLVEKTLVMSKLSEELGHHKHLKVLSDIILGEGTPSEVYSSMIMMITGTQTWLKKNNIDDIFLSNTLDNLKKQLEDKMIKNAQAA